MRTKTPFQQLFDKMLELLKGSENLRAPTEQGADQAHFRRTAAHTKAINLGVKVYRGGIRF